MTARNENGEPAKLARFGLRAALVAVGAVALVAGCLLLVQSRSGEVRAQFSEPFPAKLSAWHLFTLADGKIVPNRRVVPYDLSTPLFTDYADKFRFVWVPPGNSAAYRPDDVFEFPVGTVFAKTFAYPIDGLPGADRMIETRLLVHARNRWVGLPYVWNAAQTEATLDLAPDPVPVRFVDAAGQAHATNYQIPNANQCKECHERSKVMGPLGPKARNLNKTFPYPGGAANQIAYWSHAGILTAAPDPSEAASVPVWNDPSTGSLEMRARAYLDVNCGSCHRPRGAAATSALYLDLANNDAERLGVCKPPVAAGRGGGNLAFDIVPGQPAESILIYRMDSVAPKIMMPEIGRTLAHQEGIELIREWIATLDGACTPAKAERAGL